MVTVFLATVLCCNPQLAQAKSSTGVDVAMKGMPSCHAAKGKSSAPVKAEKDCCKPQLQADHPVKISFEFSQLVSDLSLIDVFIDHKILLKEKFNLAYLNGPPGLASEVPLYLFTHNFRL